MHMADALISPAVGGTMWAATAALTAYSAKKVREDKDDSRVSLMGVAGAFVFAAQMINFTIPATGSSGHLGGGLLLAILLGPYAAFLVLASILTVQALFFADGGLLALGANTFNIGFFACFVAYPLLFRPFVGQAPSRRRLLAAAIPAAVVGLQLASLGVVTETVLSGISELPVASFLLLMQPVHLAIGLAEGLVTATVVAFVWKARPELSGADKTGTSGVGRRRVLAGLGAAALITGGGLSLFASTSPDGLEWSIAGLAGDREFKGAESGAHAALATVQEKLAFLPGYGFKKSAAKAPGSLGSKAGRGVSGVVGGILTLAIAAGIGLVTSHRARRAQDRSDNLRSGGR